MQRRIGLAQALINDPDFLILDEPTTGLDPIGTRQVKDLIIELGRRGKTILLSSHLLADVEDVVDRMIILYGGRMRDQGTTDDLLTKRARTTIETDALDEGTIAEIDRLIRARTGGERSILTVSHPRQKLEEKFLEIVERAQRDRLETSGAANDGRTAAFLRSAEAEQGGAVIDRLLAPEAPVPESLPAAEADRAPGVIDTLVTPAETGGDTAPAPRRTAAATPTPPAQPAHQTSPQTPEVDRGVIDRLLGGANEPGSGP
jgi:ABC-2 type transport system ATP-binding protein